VCVVLINDHIQATVYHVIRHNHYLIHVAWNLKEFHKRFQHLFYPIFSVTKIKNLLCFISQSGNPKSTQCHSSCSIDSEIAAYEPDNTFWLTLIFILNSELKAVITWLSFLLQIQNGCSNLLFFVCIILTIPWAHYTNCSSTYRESTGHITETISPDTRTVPRNLPHTTTMAAIRDNKCTVTSHRRCFQRQHPIIATTSEPHQAFYITSTNTIGNHSVSTCYFNPLEPSGYYM
jgi:hypothetical protein